ncbi:hypothetical protein CDAR_265751 [Caerostris darwini]|uniref:Uncharacterized protein n=1 Tax=Caerostris darwini TaxID=1538125 RepID=A0AAV4V7B7_9ARAC|nr:hypothetical protein CDAR_265751 [Caerostris darwini]
MPAIDGLPSAMPTKLGFGRKIVFRKFPQRIYFFVENVRNMKVFQMFFGQKMSSYPSSDDAIANVNQVLFLAENVFQEMILVEIVRNEKMFELCSCRKVLIRTINCCFRKGPIGVSATKCVVNKVRGPPLVLQQLHSLSELKSFFLANRSRKMDAEFTLELINQLLSVVFKF